MDFHLDSLLALPNITVESCTQELGEVFLKLAFLKESAYCGKCGSLSQELHQVRHTLLRDLPVFGQPTHLKLPRRQFYCKNCQSYFTESLDFMEPGRQYTRRYEEYIYQQVQLSSIQQVSRMEGLTYDRVEGIFKHQFEIKKKTVGKRSPILPSTRLANAKGKGNWSPLSATLKLDNSSK